MLYQIGRIAQMVVGHASTNEPLHCLPSVVLQMQCPRSEEHTSELQSQSNLVCRLLLEKNKRRRLIEALRAGSHHRDLHAVDGRQRIEEAAPLLAVIPPDPELAFRFFF